MLMAVLKNCLKKNAYPVNLGKHNFPTCHHGDCLVRPQ